jgi:hypothetical protein
MNEKKELDDPATQFLQVLLLIGHVMVAGTASLILLFVHNKYVLYGLVASAMAVHLQLILCGGCVMTHYEAGLLGGHKGADLMRAMLGVKPEEVETSVLERIFVSMAALAAVAKLALVIAFDRAEALG